MRKQYQSHIIAFFGTLLSMGLILLLLWLLQVKAPVLVEDEGIIVLFGNSEDGGGMPDVSYTDPFTQVEQIPAPATPSRSSNNEYIVQDSDESLALSKQSRDDSKDNANDEVHIQTARAESARADSIARAHALAEQKAKEQEAIDKANQPHYWDKPVRHQELVVTHTILQPLPRVIQWAIPLVRDLVA